MATSSNTDCQPKIASPSLLGYMRALEPTQFSMHAKVMGVKKEDGTTQEKLVPVVITQSTARGTVANYSHKDAPAKRVGIAKNALDAANPKTVESAFLPLESDVLVVKGSVRFANHVYSPSMHDSQSFVDAMNEFLTVYAKADGFRELALRYMLNLACGRFLWRNWGGDNRVVTLAVKGEGAALDVTENDIDMSSGFTPQAIAQPKRDAFMAMVDKVANALGQIDGRSVVIEVSASIEVGFGGEVYPSQEFGTADEKSRDGAPSKVLASSLLLDRKTRQGVIHPQKIGNAVRTIDTWHGDSSVEAIAIEPFGANTHMKRAHRVSGNDLYSYLADPVALKSQAEAGIADHHHFVVACLVRGGAYQMGEGKE